MPRHYHAHELLGASPNCCGPRRRFNSQEACVQLRTSADDVALLAFAAEHRAAAATLPVGARRRRRRC